VRDLLKSRSVIGLKARGVWNATDEKPVGDPEPCHDESSQQAIEVSVSGFLVHFLLQVEVVVTVNKLTGFDGKVKIKR